MNLFQNTISQVWQTLSWIISSYIPKFIAGLLVMLIGLTVASILRDVLKIFFKFIKIEKWMDAAGIMQEKEISIWPSILSELVRWTIIFIFLMSAVELWEIPKIGELINQLLLFLPNVFVAVFIGWIGLISGKLIGNIVRHGIAGLGKSEAFVLGNAAKYSIVFFTVLIILTQLGVAADLVKILFTGIVAMLTIAFGLAFGLGGQDEARMLLKSFREKILNKEPSKRSKHK
jgi:hypothetical protein